MATDPSTMTQAEKDRVTKFAKERGMGQYRHVPREAIEKEDYEQKALEYQQQQLELAKQMAELERSAMIEDQRRYEEAKAAREKEVAEAKARDEQIAADEEKALKSRNLRRSALIKTGQHGVLEGATVGRKMLLAS